MRNEARAVAGTHVVVTLTVPRPLLNEIDRAANLLGLDRCGVLLRAFGVLSAAASVILGHDEHETSKQPPIAAPSRA
jgi:hypothetical protein